jgi:hypothetical protein
MAMELSAASAAARQQAPPGFFTFVKHGAVLPAQNSALFVPLLVLTAALAAALLLGNALSVQPLAAAVLLDADAISRIDPASAAYRELVRAFQSDLRRLLLAGDGCLLGAVVAGSAIKIATVFAAVATFSAADRRATVAAALGAARANFWGPILTVAFGYILELACAPPSWPWPCSRSSSWTTPSCSSSSTRCSRSSRRSSSSTSPSSALSPSPCPRRSPGGVALARWAARGAGAVGRAWRLMRGRGAQATVYVVARCALGATVSPVYTLALSCWPRSAVSGVVAGVVYVLLLGAVEVFSVAAVTAYYLECRECVEEVEEIMAGHRYIKLPSGDEANI